MANSKKVATSTAIRKEMIITNTMERMLTETYVQHNSIQQSIKQKINDASKGQIKLGRRLLTEDETKFYLLLHNKFAELEKQPNSVDEIKAEVEYLCACAMPNPVNMGIIATVLNNRCWMGLPQSNLYAELYYYVYDGVLEEITDDYHYNYYRPFIEITD